MKVYQTPHNIKNLIKLILQIIDLYQSLPNFIKL